MTNLERTKYGKTNRMNNEPHNLDNEYSSEICMNFEPSEEIT